MLLSKRMTSSSSRYSLEVYGYARCSTNESKQDINRQIKELKKAGAEQIIFEYEHGDAKVKQRQEEMLEEAK